jgi:hypothetical protein
VAVVLDEQQRCGIPARVVAQVDRDLGLPAVGEPGSETPRRTDTVARRTGGRRAQATADERGGAADDVQLRDAEEAPDGPQQARADEQRDAARRQHHAPPRVGASAPPALGEGIGTV